ncbi:MAG: beta-ketoacyl-[acyl-carrier-protein] synthase family protein [Planctomycetes bacterium]|nr:beta-ketoacyl-[acyl-carrier-protein] synthase family protein [Planctomycetota bacterium]
MSKRRVVVTGLGAASPLGLTSQELWTGLLEGKSGIDTIRSFDPTEFPCKIAGEVPEYKIRNYVPKSHRKATKLMSRDIELSIIAADEAVKNSGLVTKAAQADKVTVAPNRSAISFGAGLISCDLVELSPSVALSITDNQFDLHKWGKAGLEALTPLWLLKYLPNMLPCHVGIIHDIQGPSNTITCGEVAGHIAIAEATEMIVRGDADVALGGGCEAKVNPIVMMRQCLLKRSTFENNDRPHEAARPFDAQGSGAVFGEGAGVIVLEELEFATSRNAAILAEIVGCASSNSLNTQYEHLEPDGKGIQIAIQKALEEAEIKPEQIDLIIPAGTGIGADDKAEAAALKAVFGDALDTVSVWPIKSMVTHTGAAAGAIDLIAAILAIKNKKVGPAINYDTPADGCRLNISKKCTEKEINYALCCGYSFGGQTAAVVIRKYEETV